jgi:hypothetical protein
MKFNDIMQRIFNITAGNYVRRVLGALPDTYDEFRSYMLAHEADLYRSDEFAEIFIKVPISTLPAVAKAFYGNGNSIKAGVNLSDRVVECLKSAREQCIQEQSTFPRAAVNDMTLASFDVDPDACLAT